MYDYDLLNEDDEIGRVSIPIKVMPPGQEQEHWIEVTPEPPSKQETNLVGVRWLLDAHRAAGTHAVGRLASAARCCLPPGVALLAHRGAWESSGSMAASPWPHVPLRMQIFPVLAQTAPSWIGTQTAGTLQPLAC